MQVEQWQIIGGVVASALSGSGVSEFFAWRRRASEDRKIARDEVREAARDLIRTALGAAEEQVKNLRSEVEQMRAEIARQRQEHQEEIDLLREQHLACERRTSELQEEIDRLMSGQVATYPGRRRKGGAA